MARACVELGWTEHHGIGTYARPDEAKARWTKQCDTGQPAACRALAEVDPEDDAALERALADGGPPAVLLAVGRKPEDVLQAPLEAACDVGIAAGCVQAARGVAGPGQVALLARGCDTGDAETCARHALASRDEPARSLRHLATRWPPAATWAALVEAGAELEPFVEPAQLRSLDQKALAHDVQTGLWPGYAARVGRSQLEGWYDVDLVTDAEGNVVRGVVVGEGLDEAFHTCASRALQDVRTIPADGVPLLAHTRVSLAHTVGIKALPVVDDVKGLTRVAHSAEGWREALARCQVGGGRLRHDASGIVRIKVSRAGQVTDAKLRLTTEYPQVDACFLETLREQNSEALITALKVDLKLDLLEPSELPEPEPVYRTEPPPHDGPPLAHRILLLFVDELSVAGDKARFTERSEASVVEAFEEAAAFVEEHTGGALDVEVEARWVGPVGTTGVGDRARGTLTWNVAPGELPYEVIRTLERDTWDTVVLWAPIPRGMPKPYGYVMWNNAQLHGAAIATSTLEEGRELLLYGGEPASTYALQLIYDAWAVRAEQPLGVSLPPNDRPLRLHKGKKLEPRIGLDDDPTAFYQHVFYNHLSADLWQDLRDATHAAHSVGADNLAFGATPVGKDRDRNLHLLIDGILEAGDFAVAAIDPAEDDDEGPRGTWFGLEWEEAVEVGRLAGRIHVEGGAPELEVQVLTDGRWKGIGTVTPGDGGAFEHAWPAAAVRGVRIQLEAAGDVLVDELEAYGP